MRGIEYFLVQVEECLGSSFDPEGHISFSISVESKEEAKQALTDIRQQQKMLGQIKREIAQEMKEIRAMYVQKSEAVEASLLSAVFDGARGNTAKQRQVIESEKKEVLYPYETLKLTIEGIIVKMDGAKNQVQEFMIS